jgi:hypothetical protein
MGATLVFALFTLLSGWSIPPIYGYGLIVACCLLGFLAFAWRIKLPALVALQQADHVQHFQERLSTAYEYREHRTDNPFVPGLLSEAERTTRHVNPSLVFPAHWPRRFWAIPLCAAAIIGVFSLDLKPISFEDLASEEIAPDVSREGKRIEQWGERLEELAKQQQLDRSLILARHMKNLGRRLQREGGEKPEAAQRISTLSQYLQRMQQELHERALMANVGGMAAHDVMMSGKSLKQELQDILKLLQSDDLPREMATVAEQGVRRLSQQMGANPNLERLAQSLRAGNLKAARQLLQDIIQQQQASEELEHLERARRALEYSSRSMQRGGDSPQSPSQGAPKAGDSVTSDAPFDLDDAESEDMVSAGT